MTPAPLTGALTAPLYGDASAAALFSEAAVAAHMVQFEIALAHATETVGLTPMGSAAALSAALDGFTPDLVGLGQGVAATGVPVPALVAQLRAVAGPEVGQCLHWGATSQDVVDTATVLAMRDMLDLFGVRLAALIDALQVASQAQADTVMAGRTRSQVATPITLGLRVAQWARPMITLESELPALRAAVLRVQFGGAAGNNLAVAPHGPAIAVVLADQLGLSVDDPWHSDRSALTILGAWVTRLGAALAKMAGDLIIMGRSEIAEARAGTGGGSSTMPQKANPVSAEAILTLSSYINALGGALTLAASPLEERDGSRWALEWLVFPQMLVAAAAALRHGADLAGSLSSNGGAMQRMLGANGGAVMSESASFALAAHMPRADAQGLVKRALAMVDDTTTLSMALAQIGPDGVDWAATLDAGAAIAPSRALADSLFARRIQTEIFSEEEGIE